MIRLVVRPTKPQGLNRPPTDRQPVWASATAATHESANARPARGRVVDGRARMMPRSRSQLKLNIS
jgi:hypothetical protein